MIAARAIALVLGAALLGGLTGAGFGLVLGPDKAQLAATVAFFGFFAFGFAVAGGAKS